MLSGLKTLGSTFVVDIARFKSRTASAAVCYVIAGVVFTAALMLAGAAATISLVEMFGMIKGLLIAAGIMVAIGLIAISVNAVLNRRYQRMRRYAALTRSTVIANAASNGIASGLNATPMLLPIVGLLAFALTNAATKPSNND